MTGGARTQARPNIVGLNSRTRWLSPNHLLLLLLLCHCCSSAITRAHPSCDDVAHAYGESARVSSSSTLFAATLWLNFATFSRYK